MFSLLYHKVVPVLLAFTVADCALAYVEGSNVQVLDFTDEATSIGVMESCLSAVADNGFALPAEAKGVSSGVAIVSSEWTQTSAGLVLQDSKSTACVQSAIFRIGRVGNFHHGIGVRMQIEATWLSAGSDLSPVAYVRYSASGKVWSEWQSFPEAKLNAGTGLISYQTALAVPDRVVAQFRALYDKPKRDYAESVNSHIVYLQARMEFPSSESVLLERVETTAIWAASGLKQ
jgi:hypothetical protein